MGPLTNTIHTGSTVRQHERLTVSPKGGAAATAFPLATDAALSTLQAGGNAVDAAVAAAWTLSVCEPSASGLGGQSTLLIHRSDGTTFVIDGHSYAPSGVSIDTVNERQQRVGHRACTVPSTPATLEYAQRKYGVLPRAAVFEPAIEAAEEGYAITPLQHRQAGWFGRQMKVSAGIAKLFLVNGAPPPAGHVLRQPELARTLRRLATEGAGDFYHAAIAQQIVNDMQRNGGLLNAKDLVNCSLPVEREPLESTYRGMRVLSAPSPGGGRNLLLALKLIEQMLPVGIDAADDDIWHEAIALATYCTFHHRDRKATQSNGCVEETADELPSDAEIQRLVAQLRRQGPVQQMNEDEGPGDTTHLTVADAEGNVVALTQSIQSVFGAKVAHPELGFVYNNYLWTCPRYSHPNQLAPGCMPRSNAAPTIITEHRAGRSIPLIAVGAAGSRRIISALLQTVSQVIDRGRAIDEAVAAPRLHGLVSGKVWIEEDIATRDMLGRLRRRFSEIQIKPSRSFGMGCVQGLQWLPDGMIVAAADPRRDGTGVTLNSSCELEIA
jgi:gamma-glutamyltranspeptidase / glutathione hydrolase